MIILLVKKILDITDIDIHLIFIIMYTFKLSYIFLREETPQNFDLYTKYTKHP